MEQVYILKGKNAKPVKALKSFVKKNSAKEPVQHGTRVKTMLQVVFTITGKLILMAIISTATVNAELIDAL